jgi:hypothetical protein
MVSAIAGSPSQVFGVLNGTSESIAMVMCGMAALAVAGVLRRTGTLQRHTRDIVSGGSSPVPLEATAHV